MIRQVDMKRYSGEIEKNLLILLWGDNYSRGQYDTKSPKELFESVGDFEVWKIVGKDKQLSGV